MRIQAELEQENLMRMMMELSRSQCPSDKGFEIGAPKVWGRVSYGSSPKYLIFTTACIVIFFLQSEQQNGRGASPRELRHDRHLM